MRAIVCGANGAMGKLICAALGESVIGKVSIDGENGVPKTFAELGEMNADVVIDFPTIPRLMRSWPMQRPSALPPSSAPPATPPRRRP